MFGLFAVTGMLFCYALEDRSPRFILAFAAFCALGSVYGFLQGAWPFGVIEAIWAVVAVRRWRMKANRADRRPMYNGPVSIGIRFTALYTAWLVACLTEIRDVSDVHAGVNVDEPKAPHHWHAEFEVPQPVLLPPTRPQPLLGGYVNNSMMANQDAWQEQQERDALFTMEVARKNLGNAALFHVLNRPPAA
jgi:hypothetical protein